MNLTTDDIKHIAKLSRLELRDEEVEKYCGYFVSILDYVDKLAEVETAGVPEMAAVAISNNVWRADEARPPDPSEREAVINLFSRKQDALLAVPAVFEERTK